MKIYFNGSSGSTLTKKSPNRLIVLRSISTTVLDVTAASGTVVCSYWICLHQKNSGSEVKLWLANSVMRLMRPVHSQTVSMIFLHTVLVCQNMRWGRCLEGSHREGEALTPSTSPAYVLSAMRPWWRQHPWPQPHAGAGCCSQALLPLPVSQV